MNLGRFRLVYSQYLGMFIPVSEATKSHGQKSSGKRMRSRHALATALLSIAYSYDAISAPPVLVTDALPTAGVITSGAGAINTNAAAMTVNQATKNMVINWGTFNIGSAASVHFDQQLGATSAVLNRVNAAGGLSQIMGKLSANGQVYLINPNGILFGSGSTVNVNSLIASTLDIKDDVFNKGYLSILNGDAAFSGATGLIQVEKGATLTSASGGKIMMFAPNIENNGLINTPDGQTLLAAGQKVYLYASEDSNLRGLLVEVDNGSAVGSHVTNMNLGNIIAERGNVTLAGIAVNQQGRVKTTTSVTANGSIKIQARTSSSKATVTSDSAGAAVTHYADVSGSVELGENSITEVLPDLNDKNTVLDSTTVQKSFVDITGKSIHLLKNALIVAPSGNVNLSAGLDPHVPTITENGLAAANKSSIYFESGSTIDVSGVGSGSTLADRLGETAAQVSVASNVVQAELRSSELKDSPLQRTGLLSKAKVYVDSRATGVDGDVGTSVADVSGYVAQIGHTIGERLATGGSVKVVSEGNIVFAPDATINVSGGKVDYIGGTVTKTRLLASNGQSYDIANASKDLKYVGVQNVSVQEQGYSSGKDAGSVTFAAPAMVLEGKLKGDTIAGIRQRTLASLPKGATLQLGLDKDLKNIAIASTNVLHSDIVFDSSTGATSVPVFDESLTDDQKKTLRLGSNFTPEGFSNLKYLTDGQIIVKDGVNIDTNPGGSITMSGGGVNVQGNLTSRGGAVSLQAKEKIGYVAVAASGTSADIRTGNIEIGSKATLDVSGKWVNDTLNPSASDAVVINGGKVTLSASVIKKPNAPAGGDVILDSGSLVNASGGAWLNASGKLSGGNGGDISLSASGGQDDNVAHIGKLALNGTLRADSLANGGSVAVTSGSVTIGSKALGTNGEMLIDPTFFRNGGFSSYSVSGYEGLTLEDDTTIAPVALTRMLNSGFKVQKSGADITNFSYLALLPTTNAAITRKATNLSLSATTQTAGNLSLGLGSAIITDPGASVALAANRQLTVLGSVTALAGNISMTLGKVPADNDVVSYLNNQTLWLGANSLLDVSGVTDSYLNTNGFRVGTVKDAGTITLNAEKGTVVAKSGAKVNLNGTHAMLDVKSGNGFSAKDVASQGGSLAISAREGVLWDATTNAHGGNNSVASGNFSLDVSKSLLIPADSSSSLANYPTGPREIVLQQKGDVVPAGLDVGTAIDSSLNGKAYVSADKVESAGFDSVALSSRDSIRVSEAVTLKTRGSITLDAPNIVVDNNANATLESSYVSMGYNQKLGDDSVNAPVAGTGSLTVKADYIDLFGKQSLSGVKKTNFISAGDIQMRGMLPDAAKILIPTGGLQTAGDMSFSATTIYPSTLSEYTLSSVGANSTIAFHHNGNDSGVPFSVLGTLNVVADNIIQDGVLRSPFGVINLKAANKLTLTDGSLTSVSAEGKTLPFGTTDNGTSWTYNFGDGSADRKRTFTSLPDKAVNLNGKSITTEVGSNVDISGGGDLSAWEFTTGTGGSDDVLAANGVFAIMPNLKAGYMAGNSESYNSGTLKAGDSIYLSGGNGLPAGNYVLLPAHYALLAGGYSVKAVAGTQDFTAQQNTLNKDGSKLVSGYRTQFGGITADSRSSGFLVASGDVARTQSEFTNTLASNLFKADSTATSGLRLPADAGRVAISAVTDLVLDGSITGKHSAGSRGSAVDISSDKIAISGDGSKETEAGYLTLSSTKLNAMGAESLTIGGKRTSVAAGTQLDVTASNVKLIGGASLAGQEVTLAATNMVSMVNGTSVNATGLATSGNSALIIGNADVAGSGDGALLQVSTGGQHDLVRKSVSKATGSLDIQSGAKISADGSITVDATKSNSVNGKIEVGLVVEDEKTKVSSRQGGAVRLGAPNISFGTTTATVDGLLLDNVKLAALGNPSNIQLKSYTTIDFYGSAEVGKDKLKSLTLETAGIKGYNNASDKVTLTADTVKFANPDGAEFKPTGTLGSGTLQVNAGKEIGLGSGTFSTAGFKTVILNANQVVGEAKGTLDVTGDLNINAGRITAAGLSDQTIKASGNLVTKRLKDADDKVVTILDKAPLGGKLTLMANTITHGGIIDMPSGTVTLKASGAGVVAGDDSLILLKDSQINVQGSAKMLGTVAGLADAGTINLQTTKGNILMEAGAVLDVSATGGAGAGTVAINTAGVAALAGTLNGIAAVGNGVSLPKQGSFELNAKTMTDFKALNVELERGNFNQSRNIHVAKGDLNIDEGDTVTAHNVTLTTDDGDMRVAGTINATGEKGGIVNLNAGQKTNDGKGDEKGNITLAKTAKIYAYATYSATEVAGSKGDGGKVTLNTVIDSDISPTKGSTITADKGSQIDVSGKGLGSDGKVVLRAPRLGITGNTQAGDDIAISNFESTVIGDNASIVAEGVKVYKNELGKVDVDLDTTFVDKMLTDNTNFLANSSVDTSKLFKLGQKFGSRFSVASSDEVQSTRDITVTAVDGLNLHNSGALTLRAERNVNVNANMSAGFTTADTSGVLADGGAWTYRIAAGADLNSADVLATNNQGSGDFTLAEGKLIRTGTGDIEIATGANFNLASATSAIYTVGESDVKDYKSTLGNFIDPTIVVANYTVNGGDITLASKGNINGSYSTQLPADWLFRQGRLETVIQKGKGTKTLPFLNTSWWANFSTFNENIGTLGGGDVNINAGGTINNLSAVIATNGRVFGTNAEKSTLVVNGGGDMNVKAAGDIAGGMYMVDKGTANISSDGSLSAGANNVHAAFALGDAVINVATRGQLDVMSVFNPTLTGMSTTNAPSIKEDFSAFSTYSSNTAVKLTSIASGVSIKNGEFSTADPSAQADTNNAANYFPGTVKVVALGGDLNIERTISMLPSSNGNLELATSNSLKFIDTAFLVMSDLDPDTVPSVLKPSLNLLKFSEILTKNITEGDKFHSATPVHQNDTQSVLIYAGLDITGNNLNSVTLNLPKKAIITAGHDIIDLAVWGQNVNSSDVSSITAGRDFIYTPTLDGNGTFSENFQGVTWSGPGYLDVAAGHNINLGNANGIVTRGNILNPFLPDAGASLSLLVGAAAADDKAFIAKYLDPSVSKSYSSNLTSFVRKVTGISDDEVLSDDAAWTKFKVMDEQLQHQFVQTSFFNELKQTGIDHNAGSSGYKRGVDAIATLFPDDNYDGQLDLAFSQVKTERGGDLNVMAPGGGVVIGLPKIPEALLKAKSSNGQNSDSRLGMFTVKGGNINLFTKGNIDVAQSREFTIAGGDILDWSSTGDIDAGKGSKTATSAPPPLIRTDVNGNTFTDLSGVVSGSGIGVLKTLPEQPINNVYLIAPNGAVNAGDAGIRSAGNLLIAAQRVIGADNISVGGVSSGVPAVSSAGISFNAPVSPDSGSTTKQGDQLGAADKLGQNSKLAALPSVISVEVISLGDESTPAVKTEISTKPETSTKNDKDGKNKKD
jgi:filamentous hemagglutinin